MNPEISIIVPVYNVEKYIRQCLDSIIGQDSVSFEIIAVDDGSPDNCPMILDDYAEKDNRIQVIHQKNGGVSKARNNGLAKASGKWCYFVDSDDWLIEKQLDKVVNYANQVEADIVFVDGIEKYEDGRERIIPLFAETFVTDEKEVIEKVQKSILCHKYSPYYKQGADSAYPAPWSKIFRTDFIKENKIEYDPYVGGVYDDGLFTIEALEYARKIAYSGICIYNYRILTSSIVHSYRKGMVEKFEKNCTRVDVFIEQYNKDDDFRNAEYCRRVAYLSSFMSSCFFSESNPNSKYDIKREILETIKKSPWREAINSANPAYLEKKHRYTLFCMKNKMVLGLKLYSDLKKWTKKQ